MTSPRSAGRGVGVLLLVHLVAGLLLPYVLLMPLTRAAGAFLEQGAGMADMVRLSVAMLVAGALASLAAAVALWPSVREHQPRLGLWLVALAAVGLALQLAENAQWLWLLSISQAQAAEGSGGPEAWRMLARVAHASARWVHYSHIMVAVGWLFSLFLLLYRGAMVPRPIAALAMATALLHLGGIIVPVFAGIPSPYASLFGMPLGVGTLLVVLWLIAAGFREAEPA